jgi:hypothetical protein
MNRRRAAVRLLLLLTGLLAGYAHLRLTRMDADSGAVLRRCDVHDHQAAPPGERTTGLDPWNDLSTADKVAMLRDLVERGVSRGSAQMFQWLRPPTRLV